MKPSCSCVPSKPCVSAPLTRRLFRHLSRNSLAVIFTPIHTQATIWCSGCLLWHQFGLKTVYLCLCGQSALIGWMVYVTGLFCWGKGLILSNDRWRPSSWQCCFWILLLFLPFSVFSLSPFNIPHLRGSELWINSTAQLWYPCQYFEDGGRTMQRELSFYFKWSGA